MLPGLMRTAATPASIARSARLALKWMSAITGIGERRTIFASASASSPFGTATRTSSQPADASAAICAVVASTSCVLVSVIDWTTTSAPPPMGTPPTRIWWLLGIRGSILVGRAADAELPAEAPQVVREADEEEQQDDRYPEGRHPLVDLARDRSAAQALQEGEGDVPSVEGQQREEVQHRDREAHERQDPQVVLEAAADGVRRRMDDADRPRELLA